MVRVGVVGGGQLARMMIPAAINLGFDLRVFAESEVCSARAAHTVVGDYANAEELLAFATDVDVLTFDHEHVSGGVLSTLTDRGVVLYPTAEALALTHDKAFMRSTLSALGYPQPRWTVVDGGPIPQQEIDAVGGFPLIAKKPVGGYDGKGVRQVNVVDDLSDWLEEGPVLLEEKVNFRRELSQLSARNSQGDWIAWDLVQTLQENGVCAEVIAPAPDLPLGLTQLAGDLARNMAYDLGVVGVFAIELFETQEGQLLVNELAMRPHNSGHVFTELSVTSQFEQHLRAVAGFPLGSTRALTSYGVMVNIFGQVDEAGARAAYRADPDVKIHDYMKEARAGRKAGHVVAVGENHQDLVARCKDAAACIRQPDYDGDHE